MKRKNVATIQKYASLTILRIPHYSVPTTANHCTRIISIAWKSPPISSSMFYDSYTRKFQNINNMARIQTPPWLILFWTT